MERPRLLATAAARIDPAAELAVARATAAPNLSASPFGVGKQQLRESMLASMAAKHRLPIVYVNQVGGNDDLVFDGRSCAFDATGKLVARARASSPICCWSASSNRIRSPPKTSRRRPELASPGAQELATT
ncbi:MAG: hypothetical protein U0836_20030 [Pirellulales bacterium]